MHCRPRCLCSVGYVAPCCVGAFCVMITDWLSLINFNKYFNSNGLLGSLGVCETGAGDMVGKTKAKVTFGLLYSLSTFSTSPTVVSLPVLV